MALAIGSKPSSLERLTVPNWDGSRRTYQTWKGSLDTAWQNMDKTRTSSFKDSEKRCLKASSGQIKSRPVKTLTKPGKSLKLNLQMSENLWTNVHKSLTRYATTISVFVNDMENNGCTVLEASEAPFFMSQLLSKLDPRDNTNFGREMQRTGKEENVSNLVTWLHQEATLRSRGKPDNDNADEKERTHRGPTFRRTENHAASNDRTPDQEACPLGCAWKHHLAGCPLYQSSTVNQRWHVVKQSKRCRKCLRPHHTNDCKKPDGTTCDQCKKNITVHFTTRRPNQI